MHLVSARQNREPLLLSRAPKRGGSLLSLQLQFNAVVIVRAPRRKRLSDLSDASAPMRMEQRNAQTMENNSPDGNASHGTNR
jgi:hypothetical protein